MIAKDLRKEFDLTRVGVHAGLAIAKIMRPPRHANARGLLTQTAKGYAGGPEDRLKAALYISVPEEVSEAKSLCEFEDHLRVRARFASAGDDRLAELDQTLRGLRTLEAYTQRLPLPGRIDRQEDIGISRGRRHDDIGLHMEVQTGKRLRAARSVRVVDKKIAPEPEQASDGVRIAVQDGVVERIRTNPAMTARSEGGSLETDALGSLLGRQEFAAAHVPRRGALELDVPARGVETTRQRHQGGDCAIRLCCVCVLANAGPRVIGDWAGLKQEASGLVI